ncbi:telomerase protein component 1 [Bombina bombina]|uniref:telomerase protein component 1 n=1 Tax=Bombina bombina TaxID=8345 RepID=UPI00235B0D85|nr:telomerase protein component 1 [Bombina bombina]
MPSDIYSKRQSGLSLENNCLCGSKDLSQPRWRLAITLPGSDWLNNTLSSPIESHWSRSTSLGTSSNKTPPSLAMSSSSLLNSNLSLTSNRLLTSELSETTQPALNRNLSCLVSSSRLTSSVLTSETMNHSLKTQNLNISSAAHATDVPLLPSLIATSNSSATADHPLIPESEIMVPLNVTAPSNPDTSTASRFLDTSVKYSKSDVTVHVDSILEGTKELPRYCRAEEHVPSEDSITSHTVCNKEATNSGVVTTFPKVILPTYPPFDQTIVAVKDQPQSEEQQSDALSKQEAVIKLHRKKMALISAVCCSLVNGPKFSDPSDLTRSVLKSFCEEMAELEPEFVLKVALYTRQELNIRTTANFLLALSALLPACRPHLRRYFCAIVRLPTDWMEIPRLYQCLQCPDNAWVGGLNAWNDSFPKKKKIELHSTRKNNSLASQYEKLAPLPSSLRRALTCKFLEFTEYQLAKYNTRRQRGKYDSANQKNKKRRAPRVLKVGKNLRVVEKSLKCLQVKFDSPGTSSSHKKPKDKFSLKSLIQRLHISKPAKHVMCLLGCRYPKDLHSFSRSGLEGPWQSDLSGRRMKLKQPETWERELSQKGNTGPTWEGLLDSHQVPFMALLRNLRNLIKAGVSERHHKEVMARLSSQNAVIKSRLFPFRFLSAYKVIQDLESQRQMAEKPLPSNVRLIDRILRREGRGIRELLARRWTRRQLRACLAIPAVHLLLKKEKEVLRKARAVQLDQETLQNYKAALEKAVDISAHHNIPPLPGRTVILLCVNFAMYQTCHGTKDLSVAEDDSEKGGKKNPPTLLEVSLLLSLMVKETSESCQLVLYDLDIFALAEATSGSLLQNVTKLKSQALELNKSSRLQLQIKRPIEEYILELLKCRTKVDTLLIFTPVTLYNEFQSALQLYRREVNAECLCVTVLPSDYRNEMVVDNLEKSNDVTLFGVSEQVLQYISERGTARLLDHVEKVNERFKVPEDPENVKSKHVLGTEDIVPIPRQRWRSIRVFISSTFRDMHAERDLLIGQVMPELRARASIHFLSLEEVDLRWGITEEEAKKDRQLSLCLSEVSRSQIFIGILGERYGHIPKTYSLPLLPEYQWIQTYPSGRSITELEAMQFLENCDLQNSDHPKAFFYFREPAEHCPPHSDFSVESPNAAMRMADLKKNVTQHPVTRCYRYSCRWGKDQDGKPFVTALEDFGARVLEDIWEVIERDYIRDGPEISDEDEDQLAQEGYQEWQEHLSCAREKLVLSTSAQILQSTRKSQTNGRIFLVCGEPSQGKTVFMADLIRKLRFTTSFSTVIFHFTGVTPESKEAENMLTRICKQMNQHLQRKNTNFTSYRALLDEFHSLLLLASQSLRHSGTLTLLVDGADLLCGHSGEITSDWIPEHLPQRVNLVLSVTEDSSLCRSLRRRKDTSIISLTGLEPLDRTELVRQRLAVYGKKLEESAFNNQMRMLLIKKGSKHPLYLSLVCEELRANTIYEKLSDDIQKLPATLSALIQHRLECLEQEHGVSMVTFAMVSMCVSRKGLRERDMLRILSILQHVKSIYSTPWDQLLALASSAKNIPMTNFTLLLRGLRSVLGLWTPTLMSDPRLHLSNGLLLDAVKKRYFGKPEVPQAAHLLLAAHFWSLSCPEDPASVIYAEGLSEVSYHLLCSNQLNRLDVLLTNLKFLQAHATLGLLPQLCQLYSRHCGGTAIKCSGLKGAVMSEKNSTSPTLVCDQGSSVGLFREFIYRSLPILTKNPSLFYQQALNEPDSSAVCIQARSLASEMKGAEEQQTIVWNNKPRFLNVSASKSLEFPFTPSCVSLCPGEHHAAVGTSNGSVHLLDTDSGGEVRTLYSGCDGVSACTFITDDLLCIASYDGTVEIWNIPDGCRLHHVVAHQRQITGCYVSNDRKQLVTCSLDSQLKLWDTSRVSLLGSNAFRSPINCAAFHPRNHVIAVGCWDGNITVVRMDNWKRSAVLCGSSSVRTLSFVPEGNVIVSGSLDGWVSLWAWEEKVQVSRFRAHSGSTLTTNFLQNGELLLTAGEDGKVQVWSGGLGRLRSQVSAGCMRSPALSIAISPNKQLLAVGYHSDPVSIYSVATGELVSQCNFKDISVRSILWLSDKTFATGSSNNLVQIWDVKPRRPHCRLSLCAHKRSIQALAVSSKLLASASEDVSISLWSVDKLLKATSPPSPVFILQGHTAAVTCCAFSNDGKLLATGGHDRSLLCWDVSLDPPTLAHTFLSCHKDWVNGCAWTDTSLLVSCSGDGSVYLWDIQREERILEFAGHKSAVSSVLCMREYLLSSSLDGCLKVWNLKGVEMASITAHCDQIHASTAYWESENICDDSNLVAYTASSDGSVLKWSPFQVDQIETLCGHGGEVTSTAVGARSRTIVTVAQDGSVRFWSGSFRDGLTAGKRHSGAVSAIAWSPDGELVVSGGETGDIIVWKQQEAVLTLQCSNFCVSSLYFTSKLSVCAITNDRKIYQWILHPCKDGGLRAETSYTVEVDSLVINAILSPSQSELQLYTVSGDNFVLDTNKGSFKLGVEPPSIKLGPQLPKKLLDSDTFITVTQPDFGVADSAGCLWLLTLNKKGTKHKTTINWEQKKVHSASISSLQVTDKNVVTASADRTVKIWSRAPFRQVGLFHCAGAVTFLSVTSKTQSDTSEELLHIACGDQYGNVYLLSCL